MKIICLECGAEFIPEMLYGGSALTEGEQPCLECPRCGAVYGTEFCK